MQLVAYGAQDIYLTGNPQITFFKVVYRRHTNFSMEAIEQTMNGTSQPTGAGQTATCTISRNGDLIHKVYVETDTVPTAIASDFEGSALIKEVELEIGGQRIDRHYHEWNQIWDELCTPESKAVALKAMKGDIGARSNLPAETTGVGRIQIPLNFWFCRNVGLALPLIALQYHEVKLKFTWGGLPESSSGYDCKVLVDYIYLDTDERRRFAQVSHEYLIEQIQLYEATSTGANLSANLNFNHPVKELIWTNTSAAETLVSTTNVSTAQLKLNGHDRFSERPFEYFQIRQPYEYHSAVPRQNLPSAAQLMANSVIFRNDNLPGSTLGIAAGSSSPAGLNSEAIGDLSSDIIDPASGTFKYGQTSTAFNAFAAATTISGTFSSATAATIAFVFDDADLPGVNFVVGHTYRITVSGAGSVAGATGTKAVITRVTAVEDGAGTGAGTLAASVVAVYFSELLTDNTDGEKNGANGQAGFVKIDRVEELIAETVETTQARTSQMDRKINVYSFGLKPEEHQPSGTCNFSRIDSAKLELQHIISGHTFNIYAVNYNVLRIMSGMGGLAYSN